MNAEKRQNRVSMEEKSLTGLHSKAICSKLLTLMIVDIIDEEKKEKEIVWREEEGKMEAEMDPLLKRTFLRLNQHVRSILVGLGNTPQAPDAHSSGSEDQGNTRDLSAMIDLSGTQIGHSRRPKTLRFNKLLATVRLRSRRHHFDR